VRSDAIERWTPGERLLPGGATACCRPQADIGRAGFGARKLTLVRSRSGPLNRPGFGDARWFKSSRAGLYPLNPKRSQCAH